MIRLNEHEISWFNHNVHLLKFPEGSSPAAEIYSRHGIDGVSRFHKALVQRNLHAVQDLLDS
mgnify:CR=1|tara:strand:+ start:2474 stop:2659 length:186 start_codon:yes stop_codon:yes gene_type:complete